MAWIDYKKAYDMVPQSWIVHCLKMYKIPYQIVQFMEKTMQTWSGIDSRRTKLSRGKDPEAYSRGMHYHHYYL